MSNILLGCRKETGKRGEHVNTYTTSTINALEAQGHRVTPMGEGHCLRDFSSIATSALKNFDLFIDLDCGRNKDGELAFQTEKPPIPSAVRFVDTHGNPTLHHRLAPLYDHVFFAVWDKRDRFEKHKSAHWCPNASDADFFSPDVAMQAHKENPVVIGGEKLTGEIRPYEVGFFGSKHGLDRAASLKEICKRHKWNYDIREMGKGGNRWPHTGQAMDLCKVLFNKGQKRDGPNQRVIESMLIQRPLVNDRDTRDGMSKLFEEGDHYLGYASDSELADNIGWCLREPSLAGSMAQRAYSLAVAKHQVKHRVEQILEVTGV
jgi:hypothetical protein